MLDPNDESQSVGRSNSSTSPFDLREWLRAVDEIGGLQVVKGASWEEEIGAISELNYRRTPPPALLFDDIPGYPPGYRVLTGSMSDARRLALSLGLDHEVTDAELVQRLRGLPNKWAERAPDFSPKVVADGPVFANRVAREAVDLTEFPAPIWHELDGGRYIGTGCMVITSNPSSGLVNGGAYRLQVQDGGKSVTINIGAGKHGAQNVRSWFEKEGRAPVAVSLGHHPCMLLVAGTEVPTGISELDYGGAILGRSLKVSLCADTGLPLPVDSEILLSGWLYPDRKLLEGPHGEWTGYYTGGDRNVLAMEITSIYHRDDPIILGAPPGKPPHDYSYMRTAIKSSMIYDALDKAGIPGLSGVWLPECGGGRLLTVVALQQRYHGHARQAAYVAAQCQAGAYMNRYVVVVDDDIDPTSLEEVIWAMSTRSDPDTDIEIMRRSWGSRADPMQVEQTPPYNSRAIIDACRPFERLDSFPTVATASPELRKRTLTAWGHLFETTAYSDAARLEGDTR